MQLMPATAQMLGADPSVPAQNVDAGTHYLRVLMNRYQHHGNWLQRVIAAYNAGPGMVDKYGGVPPFRETRNYVTRVLTFFHHYGKASAGSHEIIRLQPDTACKLQPSRRQRGENC
jgi:soluble lytic murein transglycosylase-like protein